MPVLSGPNCRRSGNLFLLCSLFTSFQYTGINRALLLLLNGTLCIYMPFSCYGIRQAPMLFGTYVNSLIDALISSGLGRHVAGIYVGCIMYAEDLLMS